MPRFQIINFGCRANQADGAALEQQLAVSGFQPADRHSTADVVVLNSCTVTASADYGVRQVARQIRRANPAARIVVTGCYAQRDPEELAALPGVEYVVGNSHKTEIANLLSTCSPENNDGTFVPLASLTPSSGALRTTTAKILLGDIFAHQELLAAPVLGAAARDRTRPNLKVQDGCNNRCSFCVIPYVRGRSRSLPIERVIDQIRALSESGYQEVVLSGINLGRYGRDLSGGGKRLRLADLIRTILDETMIARLRLSSVEPMDFSNDLLDLMAASPRLAKHVHAPLQSGSDRILRLMHRKYRSHHYRQRIEAAFARMPNAAYGADVMVGFPGETDADFEETRRLIASLPFTYLHVFPFSRRSGTPADKMSEQVNGAVVRERGRILRELAAEKNLRFREQQVGRNLEVVTLDGHSNNGQRGTAAISDNFLDVFIPGERLDGNRMLPVMITGTNESGLTARVADALECSYALESPSRITCASAYSGV
ncbi:MAG: tRNA (N(6)-L-threonylcarbamoyladenosine(37)-C(2))-methylthiotransferase MtaB [Acidobacteria bacterium]|nr:tRNA (N(6)-L-threonylcarbamoyladenosine(37)-C(2))-methylthiotransferase MtaB [Acidobacteriota bacterium]